MKFADEGNPQPAGTQFLGLMDSLIDLFNNPDISHVEVVFVSYKLDEKGEHIQKDGKYIAEIHAIAITGISPKIKEELRKHSETDALFSQMILYCDASRPKGMGILKFRSLAPGTEQGYEEWEMKAILNYRDRNGPFAPTSSKMRL
jgi:hypothetical protein